MANRIPLVVVSSELLIKELPATDDLDLANSSIRNVTTANVTTINTSTLTGTTLSITTGGTESIRITNTSNVGIGTTTPSSKLHIVGSTTLQEILERANVSATAMSANNTVDILECAVHLYTVNSSANSTLNIRGNSTVTLNSIMSVNQALTLAFVVTNGATAYKVSNVHLDGANTTIRWSGGSSPTACSNSTEAYAFTIIKIGAAAQYTLLGSKTSFS